MGYKFDCKDYEDAFSRSKHTSKIVEILKEYKVLDHNELALKLGIEKNNLCNVIKKISCYELVVTRRIGKNVYYSLSFKGSDCFEYYKNVYGDIANKDKQKGTNFSSSNEREIAVSLK